MSSCSDPVIPFRRSLESSSRSTSSLRTRFWTSSRRYKRERVSTWPWFVLSTRAWRSLTRTPSSLTTWRLARPSTWSFSSRVASESQRLSFYVSKGPATSALLPKLEWKWRQCLSVVTALFSELNLSSKLGKEGSPKIYCNRKFDIS